MLQDVSLTSRNHITLISLIGFQMLEKSNASGVCNKFIYNLYTILLCETKIPIPSIIKSYMDPLLFWFLSFINKLKMGNWQDDQGQLYKNNSIYQMM
jgi:hypothetical protein